MQINENLILQCLNELNKNYISKKIYKDYYEGNHNILKNYTMQDSRSNMKLVFNYPRKFVDNEVGYLLGKPVNYISKSDDENMLDKETLLLISRIEKELKSKDNEITELKNKLAYLENQVLNKNRMIFGKSSEQLDSNQLSLH